MTKKQFEMDARRFVRDTLRATLGHKPSKDAVERATAELVRNFAPIVSELAKRTRRS